MNQDLTRRAFLIRAGAAAATTVGVAAVGSKMLETASAEAVYSISNWPGTDWHLFSDRSPWVARIDKAKVDPKSDVYIQSLIADGPPGAAGSKQLAGWGFPLYFGRARDPVYRITLRETRSRFEKEIDGKRIHAPRRMQPSNLSDGVAYVIDQTDGFTYRFQQAVIDDSKRTITAWRSFRLKTYGKGFRHAKEPPTGMLPIRPEELAAGYVNHTVGLHAKCLSGHNVAPYDRTVTVGVACDDDDAQTRLSMGNVVFLDLTHRDIDALSIPTWQKAICKGLADHGALVGFNGSGSWTLTFEAPQDRTAFGLPDPYAAAGLPSTLDYANALDEIGGWGAHLKVAAPFARPS
jgi:hypothetical protein